MRLAGQPNQAAIQRWHRGALQAIDWCDPAETALLAADSWLVTEGTALALGVHRERFLAAVPQARRGEAEEFWAAAIAEIPDAGGWFPRVELQRTAADEHFAFRLRSAPELRRSVVLSTWTGTDLRTRPAIKGPDLASMLRMRTAAQARGADEAVLLSPGGAVIDATTSALLWWRGEILCGPPSGHPDFARVDSVTARSVLALAAALGYDTHQEAVGPEELDGCELWALNALHGIRIVTGWLDGPATAERPGRLEHWRARLHALRRPIH